MGGLGSYVRSDGKRLTWRFHCEIIPVCIHFQWNIYCLYPLIEFSLEFTHLM